MICSKCGSEAGADARFCSVCGEPMRDSSRSEAPNYCTACGTPLPSHTAVCTQCGSSVRLEKSGGRAAAATKAQTLTLFFLAFGVVTLLLLAYILVLIGPSSVSKLIASRRMDYTILLAILILLGITSFVCLFFGLALHVLNKNSKK